MEEKKHEEKDNTGLIIGIIVIATLLIGLLAYLMMGGKNEVEEAIDKTGDTIEKITDDTQKTITNVTGSYQAKYKIKSDELDSTEDNEEYIELVLKDDNTASIVMTTDSNDTNTGTYEVNDKKITVTIDKINDEENKTYEFTINDDSTLSYETENDEVILTKINKDNLKYIK